jgi:transcriptional regulator with XRE-family HTH domain
MITGAQCLAARALAELSRDVLARLAELDVSEIRNFERKLSKPDVASILRIERSLENAGVVFIADNEGGGGPGVRLKFSNSVTKRLGTLEGEGGVVGQDDVP